MKGHIRERSPGRWAIVIELRDPATGKRRRKWHKFAGTKRKAQDECARPISELHGGLMALTRSATATRRRSSMKWRKFPNGRFTTFAARSTGMQKLGIAPHIVELCLNHKSGTFRGVAGIYQRHKYTNEIAAAFKLWSDHIEAIVSGAKIKAGGNRRGAARRSRMRLDRSGWRHTVSTIRGIAERRNHTARRHAMPLCCPVNLGLMGAGALGLPLDAASLDAFSLSPTHD
jgi:hypothetical protein